MNTGQITDVLKNAGINPANPAYQKDLTPLASSLLEANASAGGTANLVSITGATKTIDFTTGAVCIATYSNSFSGSCALTLNFGSVSGVYILLLKQNTTGSCLATYTNTLAWKSGAAPTLTTTASHYDVLTFINVNGVVTLATSTLDLY